MWREWKRGDIWWGRKVFNDGRRIAQSTGERDKQAALLVLRNWDREDADPAAAAARITTLQSVVEKFLDACRNRGCAAGTINMYECKSGHLMRIMGCHKPLAEIDANLVDEYIRLRREESRDKAGTIPISSHTISKELITLSGILKYARRRGLYAKEVSAVLPLNFSNEYKPRKTFLTKEQVWSLVGALTPSDGAIVAFIVATSARLSGVSAARKEHIDLATGLIKVFDTKTDAAFGREVPITPLTKELVEYVLEHADWSRFAAWSTRCHTLLEWACKRAKVPYVSPNDLRRTCATWLLRSGCDLYPVSKVLGHTSTAMLQKVYGVVEGQHVKALLDTSLGAVDFAKIAPGQIVPPVYQGAVPVEQSQTLSEQVSCSAPDPGQCCSSAVPPVFQTRNKAMEAMEAMEILDAVFSGVLVGQDGLEPSANGLRVLKQVRKSPTNLHKKQVTVPPVSRPLVLSSEQLLKLVRLCGDMSVRDSVLARLEDAIRKARKKDIPVVVIREGEVT